MEAAKPTEDLQKSNPTMENIVPPADDENATNPAVSELTVQPYNNNPTSDPSLAANVIQPTSSELKNEAAPVKRIASKDRLEERLSGGALERLSQIFFATDDTGFGFLNMEQFKEVMLSQLMNPVSDEELEKVFLKVDTDCDHLVDWTEYLNYMLLEYWRQDLITVELKKPFPNGARIIKSPHRDSIVRLIHIPQGPYNFSAGNYISVSNEGLVCFWTMDWKLMSTYRVESLGKPVWVTDAIYLPGRNSVLIATTSRDIRYFNIRNRKFEFTTIITDIDACVVALNYWDCNGNVMPIVNDQKVFSMVIFGDTAGGVGIIMYHKDPKLMRFIQKSTKHTVVTRMVYQELLHYKYPHMGAIYHSRLHGDFIRQVMYCHALGKTISCCRDTQTALCINELDRKTPEKFRYIKVAKGIETFDYIPQLHTIVTGGYDGLVRSWNPFANKTPVIILQGHSTAIHKLAVNYVREQVVSISEGKDICVHDLNTQTCIQTINRKYIPNLGRRRISAILFNQQQQSLFFATSKVAVLAFEMGDHHYEMTSHDAPITVSLYNPMFKQIVSVSTDSIICVWTVNTGEKVVYFRAYEVKKLSHKEYLEVRAMSFDRTYKRLITASVTGVMRIWNFSHGECLQEMTQITNREVTGIVCSGFNIYTTGWNRRIAIYSDQPNSTNVDAAVLFFENYHQEDVLALAQYNNVLLISASYDGNILVWSLVTGHMLFCLNCQSSTKPVSLSNFLRMIKVARKENREKKRAAAAVASAAAAAEGSIDIGGAAVEASFVDPSDWSDTPTTTTSRAPTIKANSKRTTFSEPEEDFDFSKSGSITSEAAGNTGSARPTYETPGWGKSTYETTQHFIEKLLVLESRENDKDTATLMAATAGGIIQAWSLYQTSGLLGTFPAAHDNNSYVVSLNTNEDNTMFITGDSIGYVNLFDITTYCIKDSDKLANNKDFTEKHTAMQDSFIFTRWCQLYKRHGKPNSWLKRYLENNSHPTLLNSFRAHLKAVTSVQQFKVYDRRYMATSSSDYTIRMWTIRGQFIGIYGHPKLWDRRVFIADAAKPVSNDTGVYRDREVILPTDIRKSGSTTTLRMLNKNKSVAWAICKNIIRWGLITDETSDSRKSSASSSIDDFSPLPNVEEQGEMLPSTVLKRGYKKRTHYRPNPKIDPLRFNGTMECLVFNNLHDFELADTPTIAFPEILRLSTWKAHLAKDTTNKGAKKSMTGRQLRLPTIGSRASARSSQQSVDGSRKGIKQAVTTK